MPIHCCAMQGRTDALELLLKYDEQNENEIRAALGKEEATSPPSVVHLAVANDHLECAQWYVSLKTRSDQRLVCSAYLLH